LWLILGPDPPEAGGTCEAFASLFLDGMNLTIGKRIRSDTLSSIHGSHFVYNLGHAFCALLYGSF
jgi:hypothetical protein